MQKKINKTQIMATLALAFVLGLSAVPSAAFATDEAGISAQATTTETTGADSQELETASPEELVAAIDSVVSYFGNYENWDTIVNGVQYLEENTCSKLTSVCKVYVDDIIKNVPAGTDTTDWSTKPVYELIPLAKAVAGYDTNVALKAVVEAAENEIESTQLGMIVAINAIDSATSVATLKTKTTAELVAFAKDLPDYAKYVALIDARDDAILYHNSIVPDVENGTYAPSAEAAKYYNNLVAAATAIDPNFKVTPIDTTPKELPETSAPDTKAPNTGILGEGENKTAMAAVGTVVALGVVGIALAAYKTLKSKSHRIRKF